MVVLTDEVNYSALGLDMQLNLGGRALTPAEAEHLHALMDRVCRRINRDASRIADPAQPWLGRNAAKLDARSVAEQLERYVGELFTGSDREFALLGFRSELENNNLVSLETQSYLGLISTVRGGGGDRYWTDSELFRCSNGNDRLAKELRREIETHRATATKRRPGRVLTGHRVSAVTIEGGRVRVEYERAGDSSAIWADFAVLAVPPCAWRAVRFSPDDLPEQIQMGPAIKYLTPLDRRFWLAEGKAPSAVYDAVGMLWEATDNQSAVFEQERRPNRSKPSGSKLAPRVVLSLFAGGKAAQDAIDHSRGIDRYMKGLILDVFPDYAQLKNPAPKFMNWPELAGGAGYSCPAPGQVTTVSKKLNQGYPALKEGPMFFAGEHTATDFCGYMEGALQSGMRAASRIAQAIGLPSPPPQPSGSAAEITQ